MAVTKDQLATAWGAHPDDPELARVLALAVAMIDEALGKQISGETGEIEYVQAVIRQPPAEVVDQMVRDVAGELFRRGEQPSGQSQYADFSSGQAVRAPRDPLTLVAPILARYVPRF